MKIFQKLFIFVLLSIVANIVAAQNYQAETDVIYGENCFVQVDRAYTANGKKDGTGAYYWPQRSDAEVCYYLRVPVGYAKMKATFNTKASAVMRITITDPETQACLYTNEAATTGAGLKTVQLVDGFKSTADKWYRFAISSPAPSAISDIVKLEFNRESSDPVVSSLVFGAPSTHLWSTAPLDPMAPKGSNYDWTYQEVMYPSKYIRPATYVESMATLGGYMGIQTGNIVLFSMWDDGDTEKDPYLPEYLRSTCMDSHPDIRIRRFGGEGTGVQSMFQGQEAHTWKPDTWVQFLFNARPEQVYVTVKGSKGQDSTFIRENTITTAWYKNADDPDWTYMATLRKSGEASLISGWYSFLEDFAENGCDFTRAYYRNGYMRSALSGKWYNVSHYTYGHTDGAHNGRRGRTDYGHGVTDLYENTYFMEQGGYFTKEHDSLEYAGIPLDQSCVDTINIDAKIARVNQAIQKQARVEAALRLEQSGEEYDMAQWQVIDFSDQSEEDGDNGQASLAIDGNPETYWRNKWRNGGVLYPHWLALKAPEEVAVSQVALSLGSNYLYWPKHLVIHTSADGKQWNVATDTLLIDKEAEPKIVLPERIMAQYFKLEFTDSYGAALNVKEISLSTDLTPRRIMDYASELVSNAGYFNYYPVAQTEPLKRAYADGKGSLDEVAQAVDELISTGTALRYGNASSASHLSTLRLYHIVNANGLGNLICSPDGKLTIARATSAGALQTYRASVDITRPENNWVVIRVEGYNTYYIYNPGLKKYLDFDAENYLSDNPAPVTPSFSAVNKTFTLRSGNKVLSVDPTSADSPVALISTAVNDGAQFLLYDNYYLTPSQDDVQPMLDECTDLARFPSYVRKLGNYLDVEQGIVGCVPEGEERDYLEQLYDDGHISIDKRKELYKAVDECTRLELKPTEQVYRLKSTVEDNASSPYLTGQNPSTTGFNSLSNTNPAQIWSLVPKGEGYSLVAQNYALGRLPSKAKAGIGMSQNGTKEAGKYYAAEVTPGIFEFATTQTGGIAYSATTAGRSETFGSEEANYQLEPVTSFNVSLQSSGLKGINYSFDILIPQDLEVYVVDHVENNTAYLLRVYDRLPAGEPAIIKGDGYQVITLEIAAPTESNISPNLLRGTYYAENGIKGTLYTLKTTNGGEFAKSAISNISANSAYLLFDDTQAPQGKISLNFSDEPCGLSATPKTQNPTAITGDFDLRGNKVNVMSDGQIYIHNGKKIKN